jgi:hypothetical protein
VALKVKWENPPLQAGLADFSSATVQVVVGNHT